MSHHHHFSSLGERAPIEDPEGFMRANTVLQSPRLIPELRFHLASEMMPLWQATEEALAEKGVPPPYWAFAWAGGQAVARYVLDRPEVVAGKRVLDFAAGSGLDAVAAAHAGAAHVEACDIDPFACAAMRANAEANGVAVTPRTDNLIGSTERTWEVVLAGDVFYEKAMAQAVASWLTDLVAHGTTVILGDPGRFYRPRTGLKLLREITVETTLELEDHHLRRTAVWRATGPLETTG